MTPNIPQQTEEWVKEKAAKIVFDYTHENASPRLQRLIEAALRSALELKEQEKLQIAEQAWYAGALREAFYSPFWDGDDAPPDKAAYLSQFKTKA